MRVYVQGKLAKNFHARITKLSAVWLKKCLGYEGANKSSQSGAASFFFLPHPHPFFRQAEWKRLRSKHGNVRSVSLHFVFPTRWKGERKRFITGACAPLACVGKYATRRIYERVNSSPRIHICWSRIPDIPRLANSPENISPISVFFSPSQPRPPVMKQPLRYIGITTKLRDA